MTALSPKDRPDPREPAYEWLLQAIQAHEQAEATSVAEYNRLRGAIQDPTVEWLLGVVVEDEQHHHNLLHRMASALVDPSSRLAVEGPRDVGRAEWRPSLAELRSVRRLMAEERAHMQEMHRLGEGYGHIFSGLFGMLLEVMALDSGKHERILGFVLDRMERQREITRVFLEERLAMYETLIRLESETAANRVDSTALQEVAKHLRRHVYAEEKRLYPRLDQERFAEQLAQAHQSHEALCRCLNNLETHLHGAPRPDDLRADLRELVRTLEAHDRLEEFVLYPALRSVLGDEKSMGLLEDMESAQPPEDWRCGAA